MDRKNTADKTLREFKKKSNTFSISQKRYHFDQVIKNWKNLHISKKLLRLAIKRAFRRVREKYRKRLRNRVSIATNEE